MDPTTNRKNDDIERAVEGDRSALESLLERSQGRLRRIATRLVGPRLRERVSVSDIVQSCYVEIIRSIRGFRDTSEGSFEAWSRKVLENGVRRKCRYFSAEKRAGETDDTSLESEPAGSAPTPSRAAVNAESLQRLERAMTRLSDEHREIVRMRIIEGKPHDEIAAALGRSPTAVRMLLSRARAKLSLALAAKDADDPATP